MEIAEYQKFLEEQRLVFSQITDTVLDMTANDIHAKDEIEINQRAKINFRVEKLQDQCREKDVCFSLIFFSTS